MKMNMNKETTKIIKIFHGLQFTSSSDIFRVNLPENMPLTFALESIQKILQDLKIDSKGYLNTTDLKCYPIIKELITDFTDEPEYINGLKSMESYK
jgi:hypothetical protein